MGEKKQPTGANSSASAPTGKANTTASALTRAARSKAKATNAATGSPTKAAKTAQIANTTRTATAASKPNAPSAETTGLAKLIGSKGSAAKEALGRTEILTGLALGCMLAWVPMTFQSLNIIGDGAEAVLDLMYLVSIIALTATLVAIAITHDRSAKWIAKAPTRATAAILMAASTALLPLAATLNAATGIAGSAGALAPAALAATLAAGVISGAASGVFLMQFGILISKFTAKSAAAIAACGYLLMSALFCLYSFFGPMESCVFAASMPLISAFLRDMGAHTEKSKAAIAEKSLPAQTMPPEGDDRRNLKKLTGALTLCCALVGCANELARTLYIQMGIAGGGSGNYALIQTGAALIIGLGATLITLALVSMKTPRAPEICYRVLMLFLAAGAMMLPIPQLYQNVSAVIPYAINAAAFQCFSILAWVLICGTCHRYLGTCVRTFAIVRAGWAAGPLVGMLAGRFVVRCTAFGPAEVYPCAIAGTLLVGICALAVFTERDLAFAVDLLPTENRRKFTDKCLALAARCKLSERETEIMILFAKGRNLAYIQEALCLSKSTVSTHRQHIYQKLDVHSSQEMIDLIQAEKG